MADQLTDKQVQEIMATARFMLHTFAERFNTVKDNEAATKGVVLALSTMHSLGDIEKEFLALRARVKELEGENNDLVVKLEECQMELNMCDDEV